MDTVGKDIVKQMKSALGDKSLPVQRAAAAVHIFRYVSRFSELIQFSGLDCHVFTTRSCTTRWTSSRIHTNRTGHSSSVLISRSLLERDSWF